MPLGIQRLNARPSSHPTPHIGFIKPLPGPGASQAQDILSRVAAICHPILAEHHLAVMTLEEFEPNREFLGRNFNAGEVIQLVLRRRRRRQRQPNATRAQLGNRSTPSTPRTGIHTVSSSTASTSGSGFGAGADAELEPESELSWLPFRSVVLVMLHELAHCVHMHHRAAFWTVRNGYAAEMRALWARGYAGEGLWGQGRALGSAEAVDIRGIGLEDGLPVEVCAGVYRRKRRGKKRKRGDDGIKTEDGHRLTYAERQQRRIRRKFGHGGIAVGDDERARAALERAAPKAKGKGKPRVAQSVRGRELRAQAALARLGQGPTMGPVPHAVKSQEDAVKHQLRQSKLPFTKMEEPRTVSEPHVKTEEERDGTESPSDSDTESDDDEIATTTTTTTTTPGTDMSDAAEADMVKVCSGTAADDGDDHVKAERQELQDLYAIPAAAPSP